MKNSVKNTEEFSHIQMQCFCGRYEFNPVAQTSAFSYSEGDRKKEQIEWAEQFQADGFLLK
jgi:hypothetical protein